LTRGGKEAPLQLCLPQIWCGATSGSIPSPPPTKPPHQQIRLHCRHALHRRFFSPNGADLLRQRGCTQVIGGQVHTAVRPFTSPAQPSTGWLLMRCRAYAAQVEVAEDRRDWLPASNSLRGRGPDLTGVLPCSAPPNTWSDAAKLPVSLGVLGESAHPSFDWSPHLGSGGCPNSGNVIGLAFILDGRYLPRYNVFYPHSRPRPCQ